MKIKAVEKTQPKITKKKGDVITTQLVENILVLNVFSSGELLGRHCINTDTKEYAQYLVKSGVWSNRKFAFMFGLEPPYYWGKYSLRDSVKMDSQEDEERIHNCLDDKCSYRRSHFVDVIEDIESDYAWNKRVQAENSRMRGIKREMDLMKPLPDDLKKWLFKVVAAGVDYMFWNKERGYWQCSACDRRISEKKLSQSNGKDKIRHNDHIECPYCKSKAQAKKRQQSIEIKVRFTLLQQLNEDKSVARHFDAGLEWTLKGKNLYLSEAVRLMMYRSEKRKYRIYYNQDSRDWSYSTYHEGMLYDGDFDYKSNRKNRKMGMSYLYPGEIQSALKDTQYEPWSRLFEQMAAAGLELNYNALMAVNQISNMANTAEYLYKGRFYKLLKEVTEKIWPFEGGYYGCLCISGKTIEEVFGIYNKQIINRIRDINGGHTSIEWLGWAEKSGKKISQEALEWLDKNNIQVKDIHFIDQQMSVQKIMNYVIRQQKEGYRTMTATGILGQWADYIGMCEKLKRDITDEMIYKPRELKRRHNEAVNELNARRDELIADDYSNRFPGAEDVLNEIRNKFEYENEEYKIIVPARLVDIVKEGRALHHCAGSSDRYFDRIAQRETYIVFLRKQSEPTIPYYTVEVEPGGTIRQHRGYLDEEPEIELVKPFLKEWQKVLKKRLSEKDMKYAEISAKKREENIQELIAKNNTRVLEGLMEDFMEAI